MSGHVLSPPEVFRYPATNRLGASFPLVCCLVLTAAGIEAARRGERFDINIFVLWFFAAFAALVWIVINLSPSKLTIDEERISSASLFGLIREAYAWKDVAQVQYATITIRASAPVSSKSYVVRPKGDPPGRRWGRKGISFGMDLVGAPALVAFIERKSTEYGFPIQPMP